MTRSAIETLARLKQLQTQAMVDGSDVRFLRGIGFDYGTRNLPYHQQVARLTEIYTPLAIKERLLK